MSAEPASAPLAYQCPYCAHPPFANIKHLRIHCRCIHTYGPCPACGASKKLIFHALNIAISGDGRHMVLYGLIARGAARNKRQRDFKKRCVEAARAACWRAAPGRAST